MRHLIDPLDFTEEETTRILDLAERISLYPDAYCHVADNKKLATLFYEPSTRTRLSFESAMLSLGGQTLGFSGAEQSSFTKGETVADTARVVSCYSDIIAMRHPKGMGLPCGHLCMPAFLSSMQGMVDIIILPRRSLTL